MFISNAGFHEAAVDGFHHIGVAAFGQGTWEFAPGLSLTLGGRYTKDNKQIDQLLKEKDDSKALSLLVRVVNSLNISIR